ncbi:MAG TPA: zf-HC2 domain-containing protein [Candidatus Saccharimonadales bacterium]|nr:zf-HC2 domain-containing protein [Candidatus Saccharimonadales bacterium]
MNCETVIRELSNYIDGELSVSVKLELEQHLKICKKCTLVVTQTKLTIEVFCDTEVAELPADVKSRLHELLQRKIGEARG